MDKIHTLRFAFWNTGLTPPVASKKGKTPESTMKNALKIIDDILEKTDVLGLCEVYDDNIAEIGKHLKNSKFEVKNLVRKIGRTWFDLAIIYCPENITLKFEKELRIAYQNQENLKTGLRLTLTDNLTNDNFNLFISHWKARPGNSEERQRTGQALWHASRELIKKNEKVILMGDYNDEPFSASMFQGVQAGKCYDSAKHHTKNNFYNPFARLSFSTEIYSHLNSIPQSVGTYYLKGSRQEPQNFFTFDQIIFSSNFLGFSDWHLDESSVQIYKHNHILETMLSRSKVFDHYPILASIVKPN